MRITIFGLGLIGGSLGLALKRAKLPDLEVIGYQRRPESAREALRLGAVDRIEPDLKTAVERSNIIVLSVPVMSIERLLQDITVHLSDNTVVTDTASTKVLVMDWAKKYLPAGVSFIGGHPMAGKESSGIGAATATLFDGCTYCLTPGATARPSAIEAVTWMVEQSRAHPLVCDAARHDYLVAGISHLPLLLATGLVNITAGNPNWPELALLAASGYRDTTRLASGDPGVNRDVFLSNREAILTWLDRFIHELEDYRRVLTADTKEIEAILHRAREARENWLQQKPARSN